MTESTFDDGLRLLRNDARSRYEVWLGDTRAGVATYRETDTSIAFIHTIVDDAFGGRGIGSRLAAFALQDAVDRGKRILPRCPFIRAYVADHPEFDEHVDHPDLVAP
jgi:uncharacterized protein